MSGVEIRQRAASEGQKRGRRGQEWWPTPLHRASWSTGFPGKIRKISPISYLLN